MRGDLHTVVWLLHKYMLYRLRCFNGNSVGDYLVIVRYPILEAYSVLRGTALRELVAAVD